MSIETRDGVSRSLTASAFSSKTISSIGRRRAQMPNFLRWLPCAELTTPICASAMLRDWLGLRQIFVHTYLVRGGGLDVAAYKAHGCPRITAYPPREVGMRENLTRTLIGFHQFVEDLLQDVLDVRRVGHPSADEIAQPGTSATISETLRSSLGGVRIGKRWSPGFIFAAKESQAATYPIHITGRSVLDEIPLESDEVFGHARSSSPR
jgi:hypothetical protein